LSASCFAVELEDEMSTLLRGLGLGLREMAFENFAFREAIVGDKRAIRIVEEYGTCYFKEAGPWSPVNMYEALQSHVSGENWKVESLFCDCFAAFGRSLTY
jgi:hypothetical protein